MVSLDKKNDVFQTTSTTMQKMNPRIFNTILSKHIKTILFLLLKFLSAVFSHDKGHLNSQA